MPKSKIRSLMNFLRHYLRFDDKEIIAKFDKEISILTERSSTMGIEEFLLDNAKEEGRREGNQEGKQEGIQEGVRNTALKMKNSGLELSLISNITGISIEDIEKLS